MTPDPSPAPLLRARDITVQFGGLIAVNNVTLEIDEKSITGLIGPNGAGKSTLFNALTGYQRSDGGTIELANRRIDRLGSHTRARRGLVRTFQLPRVFARLTVLDNMLLASPNQPADRFLRGIFRFGSRSRKAEITETARSYLDTFGMAHMADDYAGELSGGQRKLLEFARALMPEPRILLLDEPMAGVNPALADQLITHVHRLRDDHGMTVLFIEHDMNMVMNHSDRVVCMADGAIIADGTPDVVSSNPQVMSAYMGEEVGQDD